VNRQSEPNKIIDMKKVKAQRAQYEMDDTIAQMSFSNLLQRKNSLMGGNSRPNSSFLGPGGSSLLHYKNQSSSAGVHAADMQKKRVKNKENLH